MLASPRYKYGRRPLPGQEEEINEPLYNAMKERGLREPQSYESPGRIATDETFARQSTKQHISSALAAADTAVSTKAAKTQARNMMTASQMNSLQGEGVIPTGGGRGDQLIAQAKKYLGTPYVWGGTDPRKGLDCSGLIQLAARNMGINIPRTSAEQRKTGQAVNGIANARPGDLVGKPGHIGIYLGNGMMLHSPRTGKNVEITKLYFTPTDIRRIA